MRRVAFSTCALIIGLSVVASGCARPRNDNITAFANATNVLAGFARSAADLNIEIDGRRRAAEAANAYTAGDLSFKPQGGVLIRGNSDADWQAVGGFLDAVSAYGEALAKANDPSLVTGLTGKLSGIGTALSKVAAAGGASTARAGDISSIGAIVTNLIGIAINLHASSQIQAAMAQAHPILDEAREPLRRSINAVIQDSRRKLERYRFALRCKLEIARGVYSNDQCPKADPSVGLPTRLEQHEAYVTASQEYVALGARLEALGGLNKAIADMVDAHGKLKEDLDNTAALTQFLQSVGDIADNVAKLEALQKTASR